LEVELVLAALLDGHGEHDPEVARGARDRGAELLVDEDPGALALEPRVERLPKAREDDPLRLLDPCDILGRRLTRDAEQLRLERPSMVEREQVDRLRAAHLSSRASVSRSAPIV